MISLNEIQNFLSPQGQQIIVDFVRKAQKERGAKWLEEIKEEYPNFCWIADLIANKTFDDAYKELSKEINPIFLYPIKGKLKEFHETLKFEFDRKR